MSVCITRFHMNSINTKLTSVINFNNVNFPFHFTFNQLQQWIIFLLSVRLSITMHCRKNYVLFMLYSVRSKKSSAQFYVIYFKFKNRLYSLWTIINKKITTFIWWNVNIHESYWTQLSFLINRIFAFEILC